jgi:Flp pilus assembly protein TadG
MKQPLIIRFAHDRRGVTAIIFAVLSLSAMLLIGLVLDFTNYMLIRGNLDLAADAAVLTGVTQAATQLGPNPSTYLTLGQQAGLTRLNGQANQASNYVTIGQVAPITANLAISRSGSVITGNMRWSTSYTPFFASLFGSPAWPMGNVSSSNVQVSTPFLNVYVVLDNSPSMEIGATNTDIETLQQLTACSPSGAYYYNSTSKTWAQISPSSAQVYSAYQCTASGHTYSGSLTCPIPASSPYTFTTFTPNSNTSGPSCQGYLPLYNSQYPQAGAPCGFACHFDTSKQAGSGSDYYAVARSTIGKSNQVTLRFDVVKAAVVNLLNTMKTDSQTLNNLKVAVYTLAESIATVYPSTGDSGNNWSTAIAAVGGPPTVANGPDTGIQPYSGGNVADTDFPDSLTSLSRTLTQGGGGTIATDPQKVLVLVTDGLEDYVNSSGTRVMRALEPSYCQLFKDMGYTVFVLYTPYYPLMNAFYLQNLTSVAEGTSATSLTTNLQQCASSSSDYIVATNSASMNAALQTFLNIALTTPARLSQ